MSFGASDDIKKVVNKMCSVNLNCNPTVSTGTDKATIFNDFITKVDGEYYS